MQAGREKVWSQDCQVLSNTRRRDESFQLEQTKAICTDLDELDQRDQVSTLGSHRLLLSWL